MKYISCSWLHKNNEYPNILMSELDDENYEIRKIEIYLNGKFGYADKTRNYNGTELGKVPIPDINEINLNSEFHSILISSEVFNEFWTRYVTISNKLNRERKDVWFDNGALCIVVHGKYFDPIDMSEDEALEFIKTILEIINPPNKSMHRSRPL